MHTRTDNRTCARPQGYAPTHHAGCFPTASYGCFSPAQKIETNRIKSPGTGEGSAIGIWGGSHAVAGTGLFIGGMVRSNGQRRLVKQQEGVFLVCKKDYWICS